MKLLYSNKQDWSKQEAILVSYINHCKSVIDSQNYESVEASLCLPSDKKILSDVMAIVKKKKTQSLKYIIIIGIGGSNLGSKAVYDALYGSTDQFNPERYPKMIFLDTIDEKVQNKFSEFIKKNIINEEELLISIISKSGGTTESLVNTEIFLSQIKELFPQWKDRCVIITDTKSKLWIEGRRLGIDILDIPNKVGGRYSIFSAVGLFPLAMAGVDVQSLLKGAEEMRKNCILESSNNHARTSAIFQYIYSQQGRTIHNSFYFHPELESLGKWHRQLTGESLGKEKKGITPLVSIGSVDHHSMVQLYWGGPSDKTTEIVYSTKTEKCSIPKESLFPSLTTTEGKNTSEVMSAIQKGTVLTYEKQNEPYFEIVFDGINEYEIGSYMQYKMMEIMYLACLMGINAFDQPQVELYKIETKKILSKKDI